MPINTPDRLENDPETASHAAEAEAEQAEILKLMSPEELVLVSTEKLKSLPPVQAYLAALDARQHPALQEDTVDRDHLDTVIKGLLERYPNLPLIIDELNRRKL